MEKWKSDIKSLFLNYSQASSSGQRIVWPDVIDRLINLVDRQRKSLIQEFTSGQRCMSCGKLKEKDNTLSGMCGRCLDEQ